jgi:hypothetical protein
MAGLGRTDKPLDNTANDKLKILPFAVGLADFIKTADTPMTIGLQGEWGSGKTSLMKLVKDQVAPPSVRKPPIRPIWFDAWQYGALGNADMLGLLMLRDLSSVLLQNMGADDSAGHRFMRRLSAAFKSAAPAVGGAVANAMTGGVGGDAASSAIDGMLSNSGGESDLRDAFEKLVMSSLKNSGQERMVIFIDDLDRIQPDRAVRLLEVLKNFMDVPSCVFVVACDYQVVREGVRTLMNITDKSDKKVDAFFHKLFQVAFDMPSSSYQIEALLKEYLKGRLLHPPEGVNKPTGGQVTTFLEGKDTSVGNWFADLCNVVRIGIGTNPRAFKRYMNLLDLMSCVDRAWASEDGGTLGHWAIESNQERLLTVRWMISLLPIIALQQRWPKIAPHILRNAGGSPKRGVLKDITYLERRLRMLSGDWTGCIAEDDEDRENKERSVYPDGTLYAHLKGVYGVSADDLKQSESREVQHLVDFATAWFGALNNSKNTKKLTTEELYFVTGWSTRMMQMGGAGGEGSKLEQFEEKCWETCEIAGDDVAGIPTHLLYEIDNSNHTAYPKPYPTEKYFSLKIRFATHEITLLTITSEKLELIINAAQGHQNSLKLPTLQTRREEFEEAIAGVVNWKQNARHTKSGVLKLDLAHKPPESKHTLERTDKIKQALSDMLSHLQDDITSWERRLAAGETLPSANEKRSETEQNADDAGAQDSVQAEVT